MTAKVSDGAGGYKPGKISVDKTIPLDINEWKNIHEQINKINFWNMPIEYDFRGTDGAEWILESATKDKYHFTTRWSPGRNSSYGKCCLYFLKLSDIKVSNDDRY